MRKVFLLVLVAALLPSSGCFKPSQKLTQPPISISVTTNAAMLSIGQSASITASVFDQSNQGVIWSASPLDFGGLSNQAFDASTMTASVTYTAPSYVASPATVTITATSITNPNISSSIGFHFSPITVAIESLISGLPVATQTVSTGEQIFFSVAVQNDASNRGVKWSLSPANAPGALTAESSTEASYVAPANVAAPTSVTLVATSVKDPSVTATAAMTILPAGGGPNVVMLNVNGGPVPGETYVNGAFTSVTICNPGSSTACQTVDGVLVDTGSYGLRILQSEIPLLKLPTLTDSLGNTLENCFLWHGGSVLWGPVSSADIYIGGESASSQTGTSAPIQVISSGLSIPIPTGCSNGGTDENTALLLGANGILGIGPEPTDCTLSGANLCDGSQQPTPPNVYYSCPSPGCTPADSPVLVPVAKQVTNPVSLFSSDRNGVIIQLPSVSGPQATITGTLTFGIGTEVNNGLAGQTVFTLDANDNFTTTLNGETLTSSFPNSGLSANILASNMAKCSVHTNFYCPAATTNFDATIKGATRGEAVVKFSVGNTDSLLTAGPQDAVFGNLGGPPETSGKCPGNFACVFNLGMPFFYGRTVFIAIDEQVPPTGSPNPPWWAF